MHAQQIIRACALLMITGCQTIGGESMPTLTRTGEVKDVIIRESVDPSSVTVNAGDEVRWINKRQSSVRVIFLNPMTENLACQRNFGGMFGFGTQRNQYTAKLRPNKTASVCFREAGEVKYVVRAESKNFGGEQNFAGMISIGPEYQARAVSSDLTSRLADADRERQRLVDELAIAEEHLAERDASMVSLRSQLDRSLAAQSDKDQAASDMSSRLAATEKDRQRLADELAVAQEELADRDANVASLRSQLDQNKLANAEKDLIKALQPEISKGTVFVQQDGDVLTINLASGLLFDSGKDRMKAGATDTLKRVGTVLKDFPEKQVHVAGYTDNVAIKGGLHKKFRSNKELSDARASRAAQALRDGGVNGNLRADGYGDSNPIAPNSTADGRAKNRRVEIIVGS